MVLWADLEAARNRLCQCCEICGDFGTSPGHQKDVFGHLVRANEYSVDGMRFAPPSLNANALCSELQREWRAAAASSGNDSRTAHLQTGAKRCYRRSAREKRIVTQEEIKVSRTSGVSTYDRCDTTVREETMAESWNTRANELKSRYTPTLTRDCLLSRSQVKAVTVRGSQTS